MPKMLRHSSIRAADKVLSAVRRRWAKEGIDDAIIRHYANNREQGYHVSCGNYSVSFAEARNDTNIIIVWGKTYEFDGAGRISEKMWETNRFYSYPGRAGWDHALVTAIINCLNYGHPEGKSALEALAQEAD